MNNQIQQTYARTTSSGSVSASKTLLNVKEMTMANTVQTIATPKPAVVFLRGLDARVARTKAAGMFDEDSRFLELDHAQILAHVQGREDFTRGRDADDVPPLLADVAELASAWVDGWNEAEESVAMAACSGCNDGSGNPCPHHG
ncbi:hypothetical protein YH64_016385 [Achromobacter sp. LC458]|jgi:hypothetical protein|uniref:hypothetical protein n=1 Tax=Achromobacter TaxID=222 RepID=UPI000A5403F2|nr:hypothetical protein [Achromobacter sp. LC458]TRM51891.1 hypothetical protein YH64_016385 [Achromobacter sp. LC458]